VTDEIDREFAYRGLTLHVSGRDRGATPWRGFFRGDPWIDHEHGEPGSTPDMLTLEVEGEKYELHRTASGALHVHDLPFELFETADEAAKAIVDQLHIPERRGRTP
jgi:hypothetical protein